MYYEQERYSKKIRGNNIGHNRKNRVLMPIMLGILLGIFVFPMNIKAVEKKYGIIIADKKGNYTFVDLNGTKEGEPSIEKSTDGNLMVPLKEVVGAIDNLKYSYNKKTKKATVTNQTNGRKVIYTKDSKYCYSYTKTSKKGTKRTMSYKMYISKESSAVMVYMASLKWVMGNSQGYQYYKVAAMQKKGYDTKDYSGLVSYNSYGSIKELLLASNVRGIGQTVRVTIPEGYSVAQTFDLLVKKGVVTSTKALYDTMETYDFSYYPLVSEIEEKEERSFKLEGYLFPDTYEFNRLSKPQDAIGKFLRNAEGRITNEYRAKAKELGYTMDEILTIASIIEKETGQHELMSTISSVIHNRLDINMMLQMDCTYFYLERYVKPNIDGDINRYDPFYYTYECAALPAGPICNPGRRAIEAALNPADTDYLFFYSDENKEYHFSVEWVNSKIEESDVDIQ